MPLTEWPWRNAATLEQAAPPHAAPHTNWPSQKRLCAAAWRRDARGLRSPEGPSQDPPCSPGQEEACVGGGGPQGSAPTQLTRHPPASGRELVRAE